MKIGFSKLLIVFFILCAGIALISSNVFAATAEKPMLDYVADFNYNDGSGGSPSSKYLLTFSNWNITGGNYIDGSYFGEGADVIANAVFQIGNLYNGAYSNNLSFGPVSGGTTGAVSFSIVDGGTTYFTATLDNFIITDDIFGTRLNPLWTLDDIINPTFNANGSQYIQELEAAYNAGGAINFGMDFAFNSGTSGGGYAFTNDAFGSVSGKMAMTGVPVIPEPGSSVLFIAGGVTLAVRRFRKK